MLTSQVNDHPLRTRSRNPARIGGARRPDRTPDTTSSLHTAKPTESCPYCGTKRIIKKGVRHNKYGDVQLYYCRHCDKKFTPHVNKHRSFPLRVIIDSLTHYNRLHTLEEAAASVSEKYGLTVSRQNVRNWLDAFREYLPFLRLRSTVARRHDRRKLILESQLLHGGQPYAFKFHRAKMDFILRGRPRAANPFLNPDGSGHRATANSFVPLERFLENVPRECPHEIFRKNFRSSLVRASRAAKGRFSLDGVIITPRQNAAVRSARFVLQAVANNKLRHETLQNFMLANDSVTVAVEVPVTLDADDLDHFRGLGYHVPITLGRNDVVTGHIDIVQVRYGMIHILDYKPGAKRDKPIEQLTIYALALSRLTGIPLYHFKCAWFDDEHYFDFYPRTVVQKAQAKDE